MVTVFDLTFSSYLYAHMTYYDRILENFMESVELDLDLSNKEHRKKLLQWLNKWGCRINQDYKKEYSKTIGEWYEEYRSRLVPQNKDLWRLDDRELDAMDYAYEDLKNRPVHEYKQSRNPAVRHVGPTAASKILFILRPRSAIDWDVSIRKEVKVRFGDRSYKEYLEKAREDLLGIKRQCDELGIKIEELPVLLNREKATVAQMLGDYYWIIYTQEVQMPETRDLLKWASWSIIN